MATSPRARGRIVHLAVVLVMLVGCGVAARRDCPRRLGLARTNASDGVLSGTTLFLEGSARLLRQVGAIGDADTAAQVAATLRHRDHATNDDLRAVSTVAGAMMTVARDENALDRVGLPTVREAGTMVGVGSYLQQRGIDRATEETNGTLRRIVNLGRMREQAILASRAPTNLREMHAVRALLFHYLAARGQDPVADARAALARSDCRSPDLPMGDPTSF
jgi:hypothetical protein